MSPESWYDWITVKATYNPISINGSKVNYWFKVQKIYLNPYPGDNENSPTCKSLDLDEKPSVLTRSKPFDTQTIFSPTLNDLTLNFVADKKYSRYFRGRIRVKSRRSAKPFAEWFSKNTVKSDISNCTKFEASFWIKNTFWLLSPTITWRRRPIYKSKLFEVQINLHFW